MQCRSELASYMALLSLKCRVRLDPKTLFSTYTVAMGLTIATWTHYIQRVEWDCLWLCMQLLFFFEVNIFSLSAKTSYSSQVLRLYLKHISHLLLYVPIPTLPMNTTPFSPPLSQNTYENSVSGKLFIPFLLSHIQADCHYHIFPSSLSIKTTILAFITTHQLARALVFVNRTAFFPNFLQLFNIPSLVPYR